MTALSSIVQPEEQKMQIPTPLPSKPIAALKMLLNTEMVLATQEDIQFISKDYSGHKEVYIGEHTTEDGELVSVVCYNNKVDFMIDMGDDEPNEIIVTYTLS